MCIMKRVRPFCYSNKMCIMKRVRPFCYSSSAIYCAFPIFFTGNANLLIGVLNWSSEEPSWGSAIPGAPNPISAYSVLCGRTSAEIILAIASNKSHPAEVNSKSIFPNSSHFSEIYNSGLFTIRYVF